MNIRDIHLLYDYNYWANKKILAASAGVTPEQFNAPASFPYGGLRGTLIHILDAEWGWRNFFMNDNWDTDDLNEADFPTLESIKERWVMEEKEMRAWLASLRDDDLEMHRYYNTYKGEPRDRILWHCLVHVVNHGTQHRSEAAAILTDCGHSPGDLDFTVFLNENKPKG
jgi:uncharacterized damage-inducible protein DinB